MNPYNFTTLLIAIGEMAVLSAALWLFTDSSKGLLTRVRSLIGPKDNEENDNR